MPIIDLKNWMEFTDRSSQPVHLLQTGIWGTLKSKFGWQPERLLVNDTGAQILFKRLPLGFTVAYAPRVSTSFLQNIIQPAGKIELLNLLRSKRSIFLKLEPDCWEDEINLPEDVFRPSPHAIQPLRTVVVDLTGTEDDILARMKQKCRYNIRLAEKKEIKIGTREDAKDFYDLMRETGGRDGFEVHSQAYYQTILQLGLENGMAQLLVAEFEGQPLAALMVFAVGKRAWYIYGASSDRERNRMPAYLLQWQAMLWARSKGCSSYDLWGIPDEDETFLEEHFENRHDGLWGVYRFKRGFGGKVLRAHPAVDMVVNPMAYAAYSIWQKVRGINL